MEKRKNLINKFLEINSQINLSSIRDEDGVYIKHISDSLELDKILKFKEGSNVCDVGTGWGFPLLPLAMENPDVNFIWIDSVNKKIKAVWKIASFLQIKNVRLIRTRAEDCKSQFDYVLVRAVWYVDKIVNRTNHLLKPKAYMILYKKFDEEEKNSLIKICKQKNLIILKEHHYKLFDNDISRVIYIIQKI